MPRLLRAPLLHFLLIGALLLGLQQLLPPPAQTLTIDSSEVRQLALQWQADTGRVPQAFELRASLHRYAEEQMLLAEAYRLGLDRRDAVVRERLLMNLRFAFAQRATPSDEQLLREARALGMDRRDLVVRRRLIQLMQNRLQSGVTVQEGEVAAYVAAHAQQYAAQERLSFTQIFISGDRHGAATSAQAAAWLAQARRGAPVRGDPFLLGTQLQEQSAVQLARVFGADFAAAAFAAPLRQWSGPYASPYGLHLLRVDARSDAQRAVSDSVRSQARYALLMQRQDQALRAGLRELGAHYRIVWPADVASLAA